MIKLLNILSLKALKNKMLINIFIFIIFKNIRLPTYLIIKITIEYPTREIYLLFFLMKHIKIITSFLPHLYDNILH